MGKRKIEKIQTIENVNHRKVTYCKRKKGLLKKSVELSVLCDVSTFVFIFDKSQQRCVHYASDPQLDFVTLFNTQCHREFYTNKDYVALGGRQNELDCAFSDDEQSPEKSLESPGKLASQANSPIANTSPRI